jgi:hypothetical protein
MVGTVENIRLWRLRAAELRAFADTLDDASGRLGVLCAARSYDAIANDAEARLKSESVVVELPAIQSA